MKNSNDAIGNRVLNLPACSTVPQPTASLRTPNLNVTVTNTVTCDDAHVYE